MSFFYDLCGTEEISLWISHLNIVLEAASIIGLLLLTFVLSDNTLIFVSYVAILMLAYLVFTRIGYEDQNQPQKFSSTGEALRFFFTRFGAFMALYKRQKALLLLLVASFIKTLFIFWPITSGALFKFGIEDDATRQLYLFTMILMDGVTLASMYLLGSKKTFLNQAFVAGIAISGLGILLLGLVEQTLLKIVTLSIMYIGLAISSFASSYLLRMLLPDEHRTQGLSFSVVPYYLADIISRVTFAMLLSVLSVDQLLCGAGVGLLLCSVSLYFLARRIQSTQKDVLIRA